MRETFVALFVWIISSVSVMAQPQTTQPAEIVPWVEANTLDPSQLDAVEDALRIWEDSVKRVVVSVDVKSTAYYQRLMRKRPAGLTIVPGLKTSPVLVPMGLDSCDGWQIVAGAILKARAITGQNIIVLENESAVLAYRTQVGDGWKYEPDWFAMGRTLAEFARALPADQMIWWYPSGGSSGPPYAPQVDRYMKLNIMIKLALGDRVRFIDSGTLYGPSSSTWPEIVYLTEQLARVDMQPIQLAYCYSRPTMWRLDQIRDAQSKCTSDPMIWYSGWKYWRQAAEAAKAAYTTFKP